MGFYYILGFLGGSEVKNLPVSTGDAGSIPESERCPGEVYGNPFQYSCMGNPMDRGVWWAIVHGVAKVGCDLATEPMRTYCIAQGTLLNALR